MAKKRPTGSISLTPERVLSQWKDASHNFDLNLNNFEVRIGREVATIFKTSFAIHRFNTASSSPWKKRRDRKTHPILFETGTLKNSIKYKTLADAGKKTVKIYTDPNAFGTAARHKGFCYAAVHNDPSGTHTYGGGVPSVQRQFMGYSSYIEDKLKELTVSTLFKGFPK